MHADAAAGGTSEGRQPTVDFHRAHVCHAYAGDRAPAQDRAISHANRAYEVFGRHTRSEPALGRRHDGVRHRQQRKLYLAVVLDLFSRFVVGWAVSAVNDRHVTIKALDMALKRRCPDAGLLHHSDQGCTYASEYYQTILGARGIVCSMSRRGNCYDCEHDRGAARRGLTPVKTDFVSLR